MLYYSTRGAFKLEPPPIPINGSIVAAATVSAVDLTNRKLGKKHTLHLDRRLLDPQLYLAGLDRLRHPTTVEKLASYPWFRGQEIPDYDSKEYSNRTAWKKKHAATLLAKWTGKVPTEQVDIGSASLAAVQLQLGWDCEAILLPGPLTKITDQSFELETRWLDAGLAACEQLQVDKPVYATVALTETVLHNVDPFENPLLHTVSNQIASRTELAGAYIAFEQADADSYVWYDGNPLLSLLLLVDDIVRGARKNAIVNGFGTFGAVAQAVGATIWATGYYRQQRRFSMAHKEGGRPRPRYYSLPLAGDVGVKSDLQLAINKGVMSRLWTPTIADAPLREAADSRRAISTVPAWQYRPGNIPAARKHYLQVQADFADQLDRVSAADRIALVQKWLIRAAELAKILQEMGVESSDVQHQAIWLDVYQKWLSYATQKGAAASF